MKNILVFGSRLFSDFDFLCKMLDKMYLDQEVCVIEGEAKGADLFARRWAESRGKQISPMKPDWSKGKSAAFSRNTDMVKACEEGVAFWDGQSTGTKDTIKKLKKAKKPCKIYSIIDVSNDNGIPLLREFYLSDFEKSFPDPNERESLKNIEMSISNRDNGLLGKNSYHVILLVEDNIPFACSISDYFNAPAIGIIEFLAVATKFRKNGIGTLLLKMTEAKLQADAMLFDQSLDLILAEANEPSLLKSWGYKQIIFKYIQPSLDPGKKPVTCLSLVVKPMNLAFVKSIPTNIIRLGIHEYIANAMRLDPETNSEFREMAGYFDAKKEIEYLND